MATVTSIRLPVAPRRGWFRQLCRHRGGMFGALILALVLLAALAAGWVYPRDPLRIVAVPEIWPFTDWRYPLGTDSLGRDITALMLHGARATLLIGISASVAATLIGITVGSCAAWFGGWVDEALMRVCGAVSDHSQRGVCTDHRLGFGASHD